MKEKILKMWIVTVHDYSFFWSHHFEVEGYSREDVRSKLQDYGSKKVTISPKNETNAERRQEHFNQKREADRVSVAIDDNLRKYLKGSMMNVDTLIGFLQDLNKSRITISDLLDHCKRDRWYIARLLRGESAF